MKIQNLLLLVFDNFVHPCHIILLTDCLFSKVPRPKPLSTVIHHVKQGRPVSHATILNSVMEKVAEARFVHLYICWINLTLMFC
jgi:hypothetical protein